MPTAKQQAASRANSQKSTGPRTTAGKAVSRFNAIKHGIFAIQQLMFDEKLEDPGKLSAEYHQHHCRADHGEIQFVDILVYKLVARAHGLRTSRSPPLGPRNTNNLSPLPRRQLRSAQIRIAPPPPRQPIQHQQFNF
jgi:hypothetical protein